MAEVWKIASEVVFRTLRQTMSVVLPADVPQANAIKPRGHVPFISKYVAG